jgi:WD40 repeat protein
MRHLFWPALTAALLVGLLGVLGWFRGASLYRLLTNQGELLVSSEWTDVQVRVTQDGQEVALIDLAARHRLNLGVGEYRAELLDPTGERQLNKEEVTLARDGRDIVTVIRRPPPPPPRVNHEVRLSTPLREFKGHGDDVSAVAFCGDGKRAVSASFDWTLRLWDLQTGREIGEPLEGHERPVRGLAVSPRGDWMVSGSYDQTVRLWNLKGKKKAPPPMHSHSGKVTCVAIDGKGTVASGSTDKTVQLWNTYGKGDGTLPGTDAAIECVAICADRYVVAGDQKGVLRFWDLEPELVQLLPFNGGHAGGVTAVCCSGDGSLVASAGEDRVVRLWEMPGRTLAGVLPHPHAVVLSVALDEKARKLVSAGRDGKLRLWDVSKKQEMRVWQAHQGRAFGVALSPDGRQALTGGEDDIMRLWDLTKGP